MVHLVGLIQTDLLSTTAARGTTMVPVVHLRINLAKTIADNGMDPLVTAQIHHGTMGPHAVLQVANRTLHGIAVRRTTVVHMEATALVRTHKIEVLLRNEGLLNNSTVVHRDLTAHRRHSGTKVPRSNINAELATADGTKAHRRKTALLLRG